MTLYDEDYYDALRKVAFIQGILANATGDAYPRYTMDRIEDAIKANYRENEHELMLEIKKCYTRIDELVDEIGVLKYKLANKCPEPKKRCFWGRRFW